jgi:hypothetical protein
MNTREKMELIADWLGYQHEDLSFGLRSVGDAEKLYDHWQAHADELPEYADMDVDDGGVDIAARRRVVLGYDPLNEVPHA